MLRAKRSRTSGLIAWMSLSMLLVCLCPSRAAAQADDWDPRAWAEAALTSPPFYKTIGPFKAVLEFEYPPFLSDREFEQVAKEIEGKPEHPKRFGYETELRRRRDGPDRKRMTIWYGGEGKWRVNHDDLFESHPGFRASYDVGNTEGLHWHYVPVKGQRHMQISRIDDPPVQPRLSIIAADRIAFISLCWMIDGPFVDNYAISMHVTSAKSRHATIDWIIESDEGVGFSVRGRKGSSSDQIRFETITHRSPNNPFDGHTFTIVDWQSHDFLSRVIGHRAESSNGRTPYEFITLVSIEPVDQSDIESVTAVPTATGEDPVRGTPEPGDPLEVIDFRSARGTSTLVSGSVPGAVRDIGVTNRGWWSLNRLGITLLVGIVTGLVVFRIIRIVRR
jgi:hypothetical protein